MAEITVVVSILVINYRRELWPIYGKLIHWKFMRELAEQREVVIEGLEGQELGQLM